MGVLLNHRTVTLYIDPKLYETVRFAAYTLGENIYEFAAEAFQNAVARRTTKVQRLSIDSMSMHNASVKSRAKTKSRELRAKKGARRTRSSAP